MPGDGQRYPSQLFDMNNWYLKFVLMGFVALGVGLLASWVTSFIFWQPNIQKGAGFLFAGIFIVASDYMIRRTLSADGVYQEVYVVPFIPIRIPVWVFGMIIGAGGVVLMSSGS